MFVLRICLIFLLFYYVKGSRHYFQELKEKLTSKECIVLADFAENYTFTIQDEIRSYHWNNNQQATKHPFVYYYKNDTKVCCRNLCIINDHLVHDTIAVHAFQKHLIDDIKNITPSVIEKVIYFTNGSNSQCKNKKNFVNINCTVNPGLDITAQEQVPANVVHIISEGEKDVIHFIWSTYKVPSVLIARTTKNVTLSINTTKLISFENDAISFENGKPLEAVGVTFSKFWEIHYQNDSSEISDVLSVEDLDMESFFWDDVTENLKCSSSFASVTLKANNSEPLFSKAGRFEILFSVSGDQKISDEFPHLVFTKNSTLLKFVLENLYSNISSTRYGFEISLFSVLYEECDTEVWKKNVYKSINDELSPGVFSDVELLAPCSHVVNERSSFLAWRPVAYTGVVPIVANSSDVNIMKDPQLVPKFDVQSIAEVYFKEKSNVSAFNVTFGTPGDGCYVATKYTTWSLMVGTGAMAEVPLSSVVTTLISVGIGLLILFFAAGAVFMLYRRCKEKDDDLLLN